MDAVVLAAFILFTPVFESPMTLPKGLPIVKLTANGKPDLAMLVDTGAGRSVVDNDWVTELGLRRSGSITASGSGGKTEADSLEGFAVKLGEASINLPAMGLPIKPIARQIGAPVDVILGYEFFLGQVVELDYPAKKQRIYSKSTPAPEGFTAVPITIRGGRPFVDVTLTFGENKTATGRMLFDTGANSTIQIHQDFADEQGLKPTGRPVMTSGVGGSRPAMPTTLESVSLGGLAIPCKSGLMTHPSEAGRIGLIGSGLLQDRRVWINYSQKMVYLSGPINATTQER